MPEDLNVGEIAESLLAGVGLVVRRMRQLPTEGGLSMPERSALSRLDRGGPATSAELARESQISPQSMGATLAGLTQRGLIERGRDPDDGRRVVLSVTQAGLNLLRSKRSTRSQQIARALTQEFTPAELKRLRAAASLLDRLGRSI